MREDIYKDLYDNHIKKYEELLEKNVITEYEFIKIKKDISQMSKEDISEKKQVLEEKNNDFEKENSTNIIKEKLTLKKMILDCLSLMVYIFKIFMALNVLLCIWIMEPYGIHTIILIILMLCFIPNIQDMIVKRNEKIKRSFITFICIIMYIVVFFVWAINTPTNENINKVQNNNTSQTEVFNENI